MPDQPYHIFPLGDAAATIDLGQSISEELNSRIIAMQQYLHQHSFTGLKDIIIGYSSLTIYYSLPDIKSAYHPSSTVFEWISEKLQQVFFETAHGQELQEHLVRIPVCYDEEFGFDQQKWPREKNVSRNDLIQMHTSRTYRIYMIGFLPGFPYMGRIDEEFAMPRKQTPIPVAAGSVGIAGMQTGIYPFNCPGGWNIIGRTPVKLFDNAAEQPTILNVGDQVQFFSISKQEFERLAVDGNDV